MYWLIILNFDLLQTGIPGFLSEFLQIVQVNAPGIFSFFLN